MAQRLVRTLCSHCKQKDEISEDARLLYGIDRVIQKHPFIKVNPHKPVGCSKCNNTGFLGRLPIVEVAPFSKEIQDAFAKDNNLEDLSRFGYTTLFEDGILKYLNGDTTLDEVLRVAK
jgi:general secretion pathway protein E